MVQKRPNDASSHKTRFFRSPRKKPPWEQEPPCPWVPREKPGQKRGKDVTEKIAIQPPAGESVVAVPSISQGHTGGARKGAERKTTVSWAALLDEAFTKPGYIHEAYSRFHNYSRGNQLLALFQCFERYVELEVKPGRTEI
jgi:hypothetical protein